MNFNVKTKIRGVSKLVLCNSDDSCVFDFVTKSELKNIQMTKNIEYFLIKFDFFSVKCSWHNS